MEPTTPNDAELVTQTLAGNRDAFAALYDRYARVVAAIVAGVSGDWPATDDMLQECFLRAYRKLPTLRDSARFGPWIAGIARHVARERRRTIQRDRHEFVDPQPWQATTADTSTTDAPDRDEITRVLSQLATLPEQDRLAIHAYFLDQQDASQAAELLGLSRSGYYAAVHRAIARLATKLNSSTGQQRTIDQ